MEACGAEDLSVCAVEKLRSGGIADNGCCLGVVRGCGNEGALSFLCRTVEGRHWGVISGGFVGVLLRRGAVETVVGVGSAGDSAEVLLQGRLLMSVAITSACRGSRVCKVKRAR